MMAFAGQIPAIDLSNGQHVLMLGMLDALDVLCITQDGSLEQISYSSLRSAWFYDREIGIWDTSQPTVQDLIDASQAHQPEDLSEGLPETEGASDSDPAGGRGSGQVDPDQDADERDDTE